MKSPHQRESAELLLLCWVFANKHVPLDEDRRYLERLAARAHHRRDLETLLAAARRQDLGDVQLAAEVLTKEQSGPIIAFLRQAVVVATSDGALSLRNHHILRFLADLCGVSPDTLRAIYREVTGRALAAPEDLSHRSHWQPAEPEAEDTAEADTGSTQAHAGEPRASWRDRVRRLAENQWREHKQQQQWRRQQAQQAREREQQREAAAQAERERRAQAHAKRQAEAEAQQREQARQQAEAQAQRQREETAQRQRREQQQRQNQERQQQRHDQRQRQEQERQQQRERQQRRHEQEQRQRAGLQTPSYPIRRALIELELDANASPREIKLAYRRLAQRHHPDRFHGQSEWRITLASQRFQRIKNAYDLLMQHA
ncbi:J domain-containing protein [Salinicola endophyticus]|uniref:J domain-containing protein n=1 Tax=Salinicola endophyticus TaxID=1949083 RepID=A0AB74U954_9GAMM